jgi:putative flippase GtrA
MRLASIAGSLALDRGTLSRYAAVGIMKLGADFGAFNLALLGVATPSLTHILLANSAGFVVGGWLSFVLNARFTFRAQAGTTPFLLYLLVSIGGLVLYNAALTALFTWGRPEGVLALNAAKVLALGASAGWNYVGYNLLVFRAPLRQPVEVEAAE